MTHELLNPLSNVRIAADLLLMGPDALGTDRARGLLHTIQQNAFWIQELVENVALEAMVEDGGIRPRRTVFALSECVNEVVELVQPALDRGCSRIVVLSPPGMPLVFADRHLTRMALFNVLTNAAKYGGEADTIQVRVIPESGLVRVAVADHGSGIAAEDTERVFERYVRGTEARERNPRGLGLGLWIVKSIVEKQGGRVGIESRPGDGTTVWLTLPSVALSLEQPNIGPVSDPEKART